MEGSMRVAMYYRNSDIRLVTRPIPAIGPGEILMKIHSSGVCGSDVLEWYRIHKAPLVLGHEVAGEVAEIGEDVKNFRIGDRIVVSHHVPCMVCDYCRSGHETVCDTLRSTNFDPGGFCEYVRVPVINVKTGTYKIPDGMSFDDASFAEPFACIIRAQRTARLRPGQSVLVLGAGISGIMHVHLAAALGAGTIVATDISEYRLKAAKKFGAGYVFTAADYSPEKFRALNHGRLADLIIVTAGVESAIRQAFASIERGGTILFFASTAPGATVPLSINDLFWKNDVTLTTSYGGSPADHITALRLINAGRLDTSGMITHRMGLNETQKAFGLVASGGESIKVIIRPQE